MKYKTESNREHRTIRRYSRVRKKQRTPRIKEKIRDLRNRRTGYRIAMGMAPSAKGRPLGLII